MKRPRRLFRFDQQYLKRSAGLIAGVDEAGRGPLAGPVVAAAVIFRRPVSLPGLNDSKKVSPLHRERLFRQILSHALVSVAQVSESVIDQINIYQATRLAMREAVLALPRTPSLVLIDGRISLDLPLPQTGLVAGDAHSACIAAASIVAKVYRDHCMREVDRRYPGYGFSRHKGYPTPEHLQRLQEKGASAVHRKSFAPVEAVIHADAS